MSQSSLIALLLGVLSLPAAAAESMASLNAKALEAVSRKDYGTCNTIYAELLQRPELNRSSIPYNAACCLALSGSPERAVSLLDRASEMDLLAVSEVEADSDLTSVRALPEWPALRARIAQREEARLAGMNKRLREELLARAKKDQDVRHRANAAGHSPPPELMEEFRKVDADNTAWMKTVLAEHGWLGKSLVGTDGARAAWLFVQHADQDPAFQKEAIKLLEAAVDKGEADGADLAYLTDRILVADGKPQRYGSQYHTVDGKLVPQPIEDAANVDARRAKVGLPSMAEYDRVMQGMQASQGGK